MDIANWISFRGTTDLLQAIFSNKYKGLWFKFLFTVKLFSGILVNLSNLLYHLLIASAIHYVELKLLCFF